MERRKFSQKTNKRTNLFVFLLFHSSQQKKRDYFFHFLRESTARKSVYSFIWPLVSLWEKLYQNFLLSLIILNRFTKFWFEAMEEYFTNRQKLDFYFIWNFQLFQVGIVPLSILPVGSAVEKVQKASDKDTKRFKMYILLI